MSAYMHFHGAQRMETGHKSRVDKDRVGHLVQRSEGTLDDALGPYERRGPNDLDGNGEFGLEGVHALAD